ncbi:error-prone DNA polymerase [Reinekea blandensis]|uniref:Error-prone DNA polymerase n=1 Tax=Reinekea blandensis MED297 TaxID=314283 RepID=A4BIT5_9GAMM|nr:error-prone DNA polymerase [Reinekea blandensis]EAR07952.1 DNA polymerase III, alpha subunit [Reinekea sp. MED297] [Reinekea blandensis MED297]
MANSSETDLGFAELHCLSNFSFLRAASHPQELIRRASELGYRALAVTDECSVAGVVRAWRERKDNELDIKLIVGSEFLVDGHTLVLLARNNEGYRQLCQLITRMRRRAEKGQYDARLHDFQQTSTSDCLCLYLPPRHGDVRATLQHLCHQFEKRLWLLADNSLDNDAPRLRERVEQLAEDYQLPIVASSHVQMHIPERKKLHDCLTAIRANQPIEAIRHQLKPNAENHLRSLKKLAHIFPADWLHNSVHIADQCQFELDSIRYRYPKDVLPGQYSAGEYLRLLVKQGVQRRFGSQVEAELWKRIDTELALIKLKGFEHYFLTVYDIVRFARSRGILCQGRGSGANSVVCYVLGITEVNPREASLLFERFISEGRKDPPDIDVDFEHERREEIIQYLYEKYGRKRAALAATVITYRRKSALRDVAKALGIQVDLLDQKIANYGWRYRSKDWIDEIINDGLGLSAYQIDIFKTLLKEISSFPRHLSQHVGGFVITEGVVADLVPIENASMADRTVIQWDKDDLESLSLMKVDILALGMLSAVRKSLDLIRDFHQQPIQIQDIDRDDADVFRMIQKADTVGVFQIESRAQMSMLPRLKPHCYYDLVVQVAIVRPGPIHGDMVHPYLLRREGKEPVVYPKPELKEVLERTYGVPIFQEQVIKLAMVAADFNGTEADELRRSMASWKKTGHMSHLHAKLSEKMLANGYPQDYIDRINRQIEGFGEYGFPESHAAGFALIAYVSSWLKCHYPAAFCCALLNSLPMGFYSASQLVQDVQRHGVKVRPVDINHSDWDSTLEPDNTSTGDAALRLGLRRVKGLSEQAAISLLLYRPADGFQSLRQLEKIPGLHKGDIEALASADALAGIAGHRFQARWQAAAMHPQNDLLSDAFDNDDTALPAPDDYDNLVEDQDSVGLSLRTHLVRLLRERDMLPDTPTADQLLALANEAQRQRRGNPDDKIKVPIVVSGLITNRQMPKTATGVTFVTLEDHTGNINLIVWLPVAQKYMKILTTEKLVVVRGVLEKSPDNDVVHVIAEEFKGYSELVADFKQGSRNYH